jgi:hypothetical protein
MPPKKKGGGKKKKKVPLGPPIVTTAHMINERTKMLCPRLGDVYTRSLNVEQLLGDVTEKLIEKAGARQSGMMNLSGMKISSIPDLSKIAPTLQSLTSLNLSKNNLFNGAQLFEVSILP